MPLMAPRTTAEESMTRKADFNAEEWSTIVDGPLYAGMRVVSADRGGTLRESLAMGRATKRRASTTERVS